MPSWCEIQCWSDLGCVIYDNTRHVAQIPMSARALVIILQRFEHVKYLRYLMGQFGAALAENSFPWPLPVKGYN